MAEVESREEWERKVLLILLVIVGDEPMTRLVAGPLTPSDFYDRLVQKNAHKIVGDLVNRGSQAFLREVGVDPTTDRAALDARLNDIVEKKLWEMADRMAARHRKWLDERTEAEARGDRPPFKKDLLPETDATSGAVTAVTEIVTAAELASREVIKITEGVRVDSVWQTEADSLVCPVCSPLHNRPESVWAVKFPGGPPGHPNCRCELRHRRIVDAG